MTLTNAFISTILSDFLVDCMILCEGVFWALCGQFTCWLH